MSGVKGKSGRRSHDEERSFKKLITKSYEYLCHNFENFGEDKRFHLALEIVKRAMPTNLVHSGDVIINFESNGFVSDFEKTESNRLSSDVHKN